jgi:hypothetical protein
LLSAETRLPRLSESDGGQGAESKKSLTETTRNYAGSFIDFDQSFG